MVLIPRRWHKAKPGQLRVDNTGSFPEMYYWDANLGTPAWVQIATKGDKGDQGQGRRAATKLQSPSADATNVPLKAERSLTPLLLLLFDGDLKLASASVEKATGDNRACGDFTGHAADVW